MQESVISQEKIARRNSPPYVRLRITGEYLLLYLLAFCSVFFSALCWIRLPCPRLSSIPPHIS